MLTDVLKKFLDALIEAIYGWTDSLKEYSERFRETAEGNFEGTEEAKCYCIKNGERYTENCFRCRER